MNLGYVLKRFVRRQLPDTWAFGLLKLIGRSNKAERIPADVWAILRERLNGVGIDITDKHVVEIGSGRYARLGLQMLRAGAASVTLIDLYATDLNNREHRSMLMQDCAGLGLDWDEVATRVQTVTGEFTSLPVPLRESRPDVVISSAVLEHTVDPRRVLSTCWEWLKPGGQTSHQIDLRDHVFESPLEMLTFSEATWRRWLCPKRGFHLNRWRLPEYVEAMREVGFVNIGYQVLQRDEAALRSVMPRLNERFREFSPDILSVLVVHIYGQKPLEEELDDRR
jgi:SAM-dependent methyltransferase